MTRGRYLESVGHGKDADESKVNGGGGVSPPNFEEEEEATPPPKATATSSITAASAGAVTAGGGDQTTATSSTAGAVRTGVGGQMTHTKEPHEQPVSEEGKIADYEAQFPLEPEQAHPATTYDLFSDPNRFDLESIRRSTHYLTDTLRGTLWLDEDGDGKRGSLTDSKLNAMEYDVGIGGVTVALVKCDDPDNQIPAYNAQSMPISGAAGGRATSSKRTEVPHAGEYVFPLDLVSEGRYYVMYKAPPDYRLSGNVLPLERKLTEDGAYFDCVPRGGEGGEYLEEVLERGDLDIGGYCARSIGCFEVNRKFKLDSDFENLEWFDEEHDDNFVKLVAFPSKSMLNVGLAEEEWNLSTYQYTDAKVTLSFPSTIDKEDLAKGALPPDFGRSALKKDLETTLGTFLNKGATSAFAIEGVELRGGEIVTSHKMGDLGTSSRGLRGLVQEDGKEAALAQDTDAASDVANDAATTEVTYTLTTRGAYRPPPFEQLGSVVEDSINTNRGILVRSLQDKQELPPIFHEVEGANARRLVVEPEPKKTILVTRTDDPEEKIAGWATLPIIILSFMIATLVGMFLFRRVFVRRKKPRKVDDERLSTFIMGGTDRFAVADFDVEAENNQKSLILQERYGREEKRKKKNSRSNIEPMSKRGFSRGNVHDEHSTESSSEERGASRDTLSPSRQSSQRRVHHHRNSSRRIINTGIDYSNTSRSTSSSRESPGRRRFRNDPAARRRELLLRNASIPSNLKGDAEQQRERRRGRKKKARKADGVDRSDRPYS